MVSLRWCTSLLYKKCISELHLDECPHKPEQVLQHGNGYSWCNEMNILNMQTEGKRRQAGVLYWRMKRWRVKTTWDQTKRETNLEERCGEMRQWGKREESEKRQEIKWAEMKWNGMWLEEKRKTHDKRDEKKRKHKEKLEEKWKNVNRRHHKMRRGETRGDKSEKRNEMRQ